MRIVKGVTLREYQRQWIANRRASWFAGKVCTACGSTERLELDHIDPSTKVDSKIWSWAESRRLAELEKCQPLCRDCHYKKTAAYNTESMRGRPNIWQRLFTPEQVMEIRQKREQGVGARQLARDYGVDWGTMSPLLRRKTYREIGEVGHKASPSVC